VVVTRSARIWAWIAAGSMSAGRRGSKSGSTLVTPPARLLSTNTGSVGMSTSLSVMPRWERSTSCCAHRNSCERAAALGRPVLPVVKVMSAGAPAATSAGGRASPPRSSRASDTKLPPATIGIGIARSAGLASRSRCALGVPRKARGRAAATASSSRFRPAQASTNTATAPAWWMAKSAA
jgi:hypothetical protein